MAAGTLKGLAVTPAQRSTLIPELPTMEEAGVPGYDRFLAQFQAKESEKWGRLLKAAKIEPE